MNRAFYTVRAGDTLADIVERVQIHPLDLAHANPHKQWTVSEDGTIGLFDPIFEGEELDVPFDDAASSGTTGDPLGLMGSDFSDLDAHPQFHAAWSEVEAKIRADGGANLDLNIDSAQKLFARTYNDLVSTDMHVDVGDALNHAKNFVTAGRTIEGAVNQVEGLISSAKDGAPPKVVVQQFTGVLIGVAVAAGLSAGVGALIAAGIGVAMELLTKIGLFGNENPGTNICGTTWSPPPDWIVGCIGMYGPRVPSPANVGWRKFPARASIGGIIGGSISDDEHWFEDTYKIQGVGSGVKNIQAAFPAYERLQCDLARPFPAPIKDFYKAFYAAWKSNNEYALNGLKAQSDWRVLLQLFRTWQAAHEPGTPFVFEARANDLSASQDSKCTSAVPYIAIVIDAMTREDPGWAEYAPGKALHINTGARKVPRSTTTSGSSGAAGASAGTKAIVGLGLLAGIAAIIWKYLGHSFTMAALKHAFKTGEPKRLTARSYYRRGPLQKDWYEPELEAMHGLSDDEIRARGMKMSKERLLHLLEAIDPNGDYRVDDDGDPISHEDLADNLVYAVESSR